MNVLEQVLHNDFYVMKNKVDVAFMGEQKAADGNKQGGGENNYGGP